MGFKREIVIQFSLLFGLAIFITGLNYLLNNLQPRNHEVKCDDPDISKPLVMDYEWVANSVRITRQYRACFHRINWWSEIEPGIFIL